MAEEAVMRRRLSAQERAEVVEACERLPTQRAKEAYLRRRKISWASFVNWRLRWREGGVGALADRPMGRPRVPELGRLEALEQRVEKLEHELQELRAKVRVG
jgi:hypothetical protein